MIQPADLLAALLDACRMGLVTHCEAGKLLCLRKEDVGDLVAWRMIEVAMWRVYVSAFHTTFPECDWRLRRGADPVQHVPQTPPPQPAECHHYDAIQAATLPPSQASIYAPPPNAAHDFPEPENADAWDNSY